MHRMWQAKITARLSGDESDTEERRPFILSLHKSKMSKGERQYTRSRLCNVGCAWREPAMRLWCTKSTREDRPRRSNARLWILGVRCGRVQVLFAGSQRQVGRKRRSGCERCAAVHTLAPVRKIKRIQTIDLALFRISFDAMHVQPHGVCGCDLGEC